MRLEALGPARGMITGLEELDRLLKDAIKSTFEARAKAYDSEVRHPPVCRAILECMYAMICFCIFWASENGCQMQWWASRTILQACSHGALLAL